MCPSYKVAWVALFRPRFIVWSVQRHISRLDWGVSSSVLQRNKRHGARPKGELISSLVTTPSLNTISPAPAAQWSNSLLGRAVWSCEWARGGLRSECISPAGEVRWEKSAVRWSDRSASPSERTRTASLSPLPPEQNYGVFANIKEPWRRKLPSWRQNGCSTAALSVAVARTSAKSKCLSLKTLFFYGVNP